MSKAKIGDIVQIIEGKWIGAFVHVTSEYNWGIQGFIYIPDKGQAFVRLKEEEYEIVGHSFLRLKEEE